MVMVIHVTVIVVEPVVVDVVVDLAVKTEQFTNRSMPEISPSAQKLFSGKSRRKRKWNWPRFLVNPFSI